MKNQKIRTGKLQMKAMLLAGVLVFESVFASVTTASAQTVSENKIEAEEITNVTVSENETAVSENEVTEDALKSKSLQVQEEQVSAEKSAIKYSGTDGGVVWSIDKNGHLLLTGDGNYVETPDWTISNRSTEIVTAEVRVKNMTSTADMFSGCENLKSVDFTDFDTSKVTNMSYMFYFCQALESLDLSHFDTSNVVYMNNMFFMCWLEELDLSGFNTGNVTDMQYMFAYCNNLKKLDISNFDTSNVTDMQSMFYNCYNLEELNISSFNTGNVTDMEAMFCSCEKLSELDLSHFDIGKVTRMENIFSRTVNLVIIKLPNLPFEVALYNYYLDEENNLTQIAKANAGKKTYRLMEYVDSYCGKNGHTYSLPNFTWAPDYSSAKVYLECTREDCFFGTDHKILKLDAVVTKKTVNPTVEKEGEILYTATAVYNGKTYTDVKKIPIPKLIAKSVGTSMDFSSGLYRVVKTGTIPELAYMGPKNKKVKTVTIPATVTIDGVTYKVTSVATGALKNYKNLTKVTVGSNVTKIGKNAFYGCKKLKKIIIKSKKLKSIGKNALKGIKKNAVIDVANSKKKAYKKLLTKKTGYKKTMSVK